MKQLILISTLLLAIVSLQAQTGEITGIIKDAETGEPAMFVSVYVQINGSMVGTITDEYGRYTIKPLPEGVYTLITSSTEYAADTIENVIVNPDGIRNLDIALGEGVNVIGPTTIHSGLFNMDVAVPTPVIPGKIFRESPAMTIPDIVSTTIGVYQSDAGETPIFRGARVENTIFMFEGIRMRGDTYISKAAIGSVKVINGGMPAKYGDSTGGIIVISMRGYPML